MMKDFGTQMRRLAKQVALVGAVALLHSACGDDPPPPPPKSDPSGAAQKPPGAGAPAGAARPAVPGQKAGGLQMYVKIEDIVPEPTEASDLRWTFRDRDFIPDMMGVENRDPFRSYVINSSASLNSKVTVEATELCKGSQLKASQYPYTALTLTGIIEQGTRSYAIFVDPSNLGHLVKRNDCLGKEKARIREISSTQSLVRVDIYPEADPSAGAVAAQQKSIPLYPEDVRINDTQDVTEERDQPPPVIIKPEAGAGGGTNP